MPEAPESSGQHAREQEGQAANGGYTAYLPEQAPGQAHSALQAQHRQAAQPAQQKSRVDYELLPRVAPYPLEGDIIAYRLLHIGADWSPQVGVLASAGVQLACMPSYMLVVLLVG